MKKIIMEICFDGSLKKAFLPYAKKHILKTTYLNFIKKDVKNIFLKNAKIKKKVIMKSRYYDIKKCI